VSNRYGSLSGDSEFAHPTDQGRARQTKPDGRTVPSAHNPVNLPKHVDNMVTLSLGECMSWRWLVALGHAFKLSRREVQVRPRRHDHGALDEALQLPDITRPIMAFEDFHH
jgi:hypothetical protein